MRTTVDYLLPLFLFRYSGIMRDRNDATIRVVQYADEYADAFIALNLEWIEKLFVVEEQDRRELENPRQHFIDTGGQILFAVQGEDVIGTCALLRDSNDGFELCKMAVAPDARGRGIGEVLLQSAIDYAAAQGARRVWLLSASSLKSAISLYEKFGFQRIALGDTPGYEKCNVRMQLGLNRD